MSMLLPVGALVAFFVCVQASRISIQDANKDELELESPKDHLPICSYISTDDCGSYYEKSSGDSPFNGKQFYEICEVLCLGWAPRPDGPMHRPNSPVPQPAPPPFSPSPGPRPASGCPAPPDCIVGGYTKTKRPSTSWDICTGCWEESCVRDVNITDAWSLFKGDYESAYQAGLRVLQKVYPAAAAEWEYQENKATSTGSEHYRQGIKNFVSLKNADEAVQLNVPVHENVHVHHSTTMTFRPTNDYSQDAIEVPSERNPHAGMTLQYEKRPLHAWTWGFPARMEIWDLIPSDIQAQHQGPSYFKKPDATKSVEQICGNSIAGPLGCQRVFGIMTETEAYQTGVMATAFMNYGVGSDNTWTPNVKHNGYNEGAPFPIAFWSYANVLYLQVTKEKYPAAWKNMKGMGSVDWTDTAKLFLAHIDRASFVMRLFLDKNGMKRPMIKEAERCRDLQWEALAKDDVVKELRAAMTGCTR